MRVLLHFAASLSLSASQEQSRPDGSSDHGGASNTHSTEPALCGECGGKHKRMISQNLQKKQVHASKAKQRPAAGSALPVRLTSCIFPRPVTLITAHPGNEVNCGPQEDELEKPEQLCASWRLQAVRHQGTKGEVLSQSDFAKASRVMTVAHRRGSRGQPAVESLHATLGLSPFCTEMIPEAFHLLPPAYNQQVTAADIQSQMEKVKKARERLAKALQADRLAREAERMSDPEERAENQRGTGAETVGGSRCEAAGERVSP
nr:methyl-CpG-binding domain protein 3-like 2B [Cavia porcellus]